MRLLSTCLILFLLTGTSISAEEQTDALEVKSGEAEYNGRSITLTGDVLVQHGLGTIAARRFTFSPEDESQGKPTLLLVEEEVRIKFEGGGELSCQQATVDCKSLCGVFTGRPNQLDVVYDHGSTPHLIVKAVMMEANFIRRGEPAGSKKIALNQIWSKQGVWIRYQNDELEADEAVFQKDFNRPENRAGTLTLLAVERPFCTVKRANGDLLQAKKITVDTLRNEIILEHVQGTMANQREGEAKQINFTSDWAKWDDQEQKAALAGNVYVFEDMLGESYADRVEILYGPEKQKRAPSQIVMIGNVQIFNRFDGHLEESGSVLQYALADQVDYDPAKQEMKLTSSEGKRVLFFDKINSVQMSAPALHVNLDEKTRKASIKGIGDVRFTFIEQELDQLKQRFRLGKKDK